MSAEKKEKFQFTEEIVKAFNVLGLNSNDYASVSKAVKDEAVKNAYRKKAFQHHPDRHSSESEIIQKEQVEIFKNISTAHELLTEIHKPTSRATKLFDIPLSALSKIEILYFQNRVEVEIPGHRKDVDIADASLFSEYYADTQDLVDAYRDDDLGVNIIKNAKAERVEYNHFLNILIRHYRRIIIIFFAEENRDNFYYRRYMNMPIIWHKMAYRKLLNPLKWVATIIAMVLAVVGSLLDYFSMLLLKTCISYLMRVRATQVDEGFLATVKHILSAITFQVSGQLLLFIWQFFQSTRVIYRLGVDAITAIFTPINSTIRPLAYFFNRQPLILLLTAIVSLALVVSGIAIAMGILSVPTVLLSYATSIPKTLSTLAVSAWNSELFFAWVILGSLIPLIWKQEYADEALGINGMLNTPSMNEEVNVDFKEAYLKGMPKASMSSQYFWTPENARYMESWEQDDFSYAFRSFFGGGYQEDADYISAFYKSGAGANPKFTPSTDSKEDESMNHAMLMLKAAPTK